MQGACRGILKGTGGSIVQTVSSHSTSDLEKRHFTPNKWVGVGGGGQGGGGGCWHVPPKYGTGGSMVFTYSALNK